MFSFSFFFAGGGGGGWGGAQTGEVVVNTPDLFGNIILALENFNSLTPIPLEFPMMLLVLGNDMLIIILFS